MKGFRWRHSSWSTQINFIDSTDDEDKQKKTCQAFLQTTVSSINPRNRPCPSNALPPQPFARNRQHQDPLLVSSRISRRLVLSAPESGPLETTTHSIKNDTTEKKERVAPHIFEATHNPSHLLNVRPNYSSYLRIVHHPPPNLALHAKRQHPTN